MVQAQRALKSCIRKNAGALCVSFSTEIAVSSLLWKAGTQKLQADKALGELEEPETGDS